MLIDRFENVATPATAATVVVPVSAPPPTLFAIASVTLPVNPVATLPLPSSARTVMAGRMATLAVASVGCCAKTSCVAAAGMTLNAVDVAPIRLVALAPSWYPVPTLSIERVENVATPRAAATVDAPDRTPAPGLVTIATVISLAYVVSVLPNGSRAVTWTGGAIAEPETAFVGCTVNTSWVAGAGLTANPADGALVSAPLVTVSV